MDQHDTASIYSFDFLILSEIYLNTATRFRILLFLKLKYSQVFDAYCNLFEVNAKTQIPTIADTCILGFGQVCKGETIGILYYSCIAFPIERGIPKM